ncbi:MAG: polysaccharide ABC transporter ATP-binding protein [Actinomycetota bacterium]
MDILVANSVTKNYRVGVGRARIREMIPPPFDTGLAKVFKSWWYKNTFNALEDVNITVPSGSSLGLVGHNGAGKTTLLRVIAGVTAPTAGSIQVRGRVAALIDAMVGFHLELTGRENIYYLGSMHGFGRRDMRTRIQRISEFAEIDEMLDTPVKRYSAGMSARLGFATIATLDPEILLIDEVLAVGDANFQHRCIKWLDDYRRGGGTLLFVSHNLGLVRNMTQQVAWLDHGQVVQEGPTSKVLADYARAMERRTSAVPGTKGGSAARKLMKATGMNRWGAGGARALEVHVGEPTRHNGVKVSISYEAAHVERAVFCIGFIDEAGRELGAAVSRPLVLHEGGGSVSCNIDNLGFRSGIYFPVVGILSPEGTIHDRWRLDRAVVIERDHDYFPDDFGSVEIPSAWSNGHGGQIPVTRAASNDRGPG